MTSLPPEPPEKRLGLVIDLDTCVGCQACVVACKEWNTSGFPAPLTDQDPYGLEPRGAWLNRVHGYEVSPGEVSPGEVGPGARPGESGAAGQTVHFPKSCLHCDEAACVTVCPTGASYKRSEDGIVLVDESKCIGCGLCAWACPYGARELDADQGVMKKCTLCIDRIYNQNLPEADRQPACVATCPVGARHFGDLADPDSAVSRLVTARDGYGPMPELGYQPTNRYLPPRPRKTTPGCTGAPAALEPAEPTGGFLGWLDRVLGD